MNELTADELFALAEQKRAAEQAEVARVNTEKAAALKAKRKEVQAAMNKELKAIDAELAKLLGKSKGYKRNQTDIPVTEIVLEIVGNAGQIGTSDIKAALEQRGIDTTNLPQTLAYLKRTARLSSPARTLYQLAK